MNIPLQRTYHLTPRGGAGLSCDEKGVALGDVALVRGRQDAEGGARCEVRSAAQIGQILQTAYGPQREASIQRLHRGLYRVAACIEAGDLARAGVEAVMLGLPDLAPDAMAKLAKLADLEKDANAAWETEPRLPAGQTGGGQWTTGGGGAAMVTPATNACAGAVTADPTAGGFHIHVGASATIADGRGLITDFTLSPDVTRLGRAGLLAFAATMLDQWDADRARAQITNAMTRFDPSRPAEVVAASAYVWSEYNLPLSTDAPFSGPKLDAASQAVMSFVLANPGVFTAMLQGPAPRAQEAHSMVIDAANLGLADATTAESRARPRGVAPELQAKSWAARKAITQELTEGNMQAHHLVSAHNWGQRPDISGAAIKAGWDPNAASNVIGLPVDAETQAKLEAEVGLRLPRHDGSHGKYNIITTKLIEDQEAKYPKPLSPVDARAVLNEVARINREDILLGKYDPIIKAVA
jgi:A nuclease family of the HNH/ENDO VII superfamily with conserved AHH